MTDVDRMTLIEVAKFYRVGTRKARKMAEAGLIPCAWEDTFRAGEPVRTPRFSRTRIEAYERRKGELEAEREAS